MSDQKPIVPCLILPEICSLILIGRIASLKVDTEGSEADTIGLLPDLPQYVKPTFISVELGGGGHSLASKKGGWSSEFFEGTKRLLEIAEREGYSATIVLEMNSFLPSLRLGSAVFDISQLFQSDFLVRNLLIIRDPSDATIFSKLIRSSLHAFAYSYFQCHLRGTINNATFLLLRIKQKLIRRNRDKL